MSTWDDGRRLDGMRRRREREVCQQWPYRQPREHDEAKRLALQAVKNALRLGTLERQPCEVCGAAEVEGHHPDYNRPLEIRWLCRTHHREADSQREADRTGQPQDVRKWTKRRLREDKSLPLVRAITHDIDRAAIAQRVTQREIAEALFMSQPCVSMMFTGGIRSLRHIADLCDFLGLEFTYRIEVRKEKEQAS